MPVVSEFTEFGEKLSLSQTGLGRPITQDGQSRGRVERMDLVLDAAEHVHAANGAGVALNRPTKIDDFQFRGMRGDSALLRETTATCENNAPSGFQHLLQPQAWSCAVCALSATPTRSDLQ